jgi:hypothetical protein
MNGWMDGWMDQWSGERPKHAHTHPPPSLPHLPLEREFEVSVAHVGVFRPADRAHVSWGQHILRTFFVGFFCGFASAFFGLCALLSV